MNKGAPGSSYELSRQGHEDVHQEKIHGYDGSYSKSIGYFYTTVS